MKPNFEINLERILGWSFESVAKTKVCTFKMKDTSMLLTVQKMFKKAKTHKDNTWKEIVANNIRFMDHATVVHCQGFSLFSNNVPHDFTAKFEVYCHKLHEDLTIASTPKKLRKKINDLSGSVGRSVGKRLSGLVSYQILYAC